MESPESGVGAYGLRFTGAALSPAVSVPAPASWPTVALSCDPSAPPRRSGLAPGCASIEVDGQRTLVAERDPAVAAFHGPPLDADVLAHPYLGVAAALFSRWLGREAFHGGAFVTEGGGAIAVLGGRFAGKSTLMAALAGSGLTVLADDLVVLDGRTLFTGPRTIDLRREPTTELRGPLHAAPARGGSRWRLELPPAAPSHRLAGWVFLHADEHATVEARGIGAQRRLRRLAKARAHPSLDSDPTHLLELAALPAWDLIRPLSWESLPRTVEVLRRLGREATRAASPPTLDTT